MLNLRKVKDGSGLFRFKYKDKEVKATKKEKGGKLKQVVVSEEESMQTDYMTLTAMYLTAAKNAFGDKHKRAMQMVASNYLTVSEFSEKLSKKASWGNQISLLDCTGCQPIIDIAVENKKVTSWDIKYLTRRQIKDYMTSVTYVPCDRMFYERKPDGTVGLKMLSAVWVLQREEAIKEVTEKYTGLDREQILKEKAEAWGTRKDNAEEIEDGQYFMRVDVESSGFFYRIMKQANPNPLSSLVFHSYRTLVWASKDSIPSNVEAVVTFNDIENTVLTSAMMVTLHWVYNTPNLDFNGCVKKFLSNVDTILSYDEAAVSNKMLRNCARITWDNNKLKTRCQTLDNTLRVFINARPYERHTEVMRMAKALIDGTGPPDELNQAQKERYNELLTLVQEDEALKRVYRAAVTIEFLTDCRVRLDSGEWEIEDACTAVARQAGELPMVTYKQIVEQALTIIDILDYNVLEVTEFKGHLIKEAKNMSSSRVLLTTQQEVLKRRLVDAVNEFRGPCYTTLRSYKEALFASEVNPSGFVDACLRLKGEIGELVAMTHLEKTGRSTSGYVDEQEKPTMFEIVNNHFGEITTHQFRNTTFKQAMQRVDLTGVKIRKKCDGYLLKEQTKKGRTTKSVVINEVKWMRSYGGDNPTREKDEAIKKDRLKVESVMKPFNGVIRWDVEVKVYSDREMVELAEFLDGAAGVRYKEIVQSIIDFTNDVFSTKNKMLRRLYEERKSQIKTRSCTDIIAGNIIDSKANDYLTLATQEDGLQLGHGLYPNAAKTGLFVTLGVMGGHAPLLTDQELLELTKHANVHARHRTEYITSAKEGESREHFFDEFAGEMEKEINDLKAKEVIRDPEGDMYIENKFLLGHLTADLIKAMNLYGDGRCACSQPNHDLTFEITKLLRMTTSSGCKNPKSGDRFKNQVASAILTKCCKGRCWFVSKSGKLARGMMPNKGCDRTFLAKNLKGLLVQTGLVDSDLAQRLSLDLNTDVFESCDTDLKKLLGQLVKAKPANGEVSNDMDIVRVALTCILLIAKGAQLCPEKKLVWEESEFKSIQDQIEDFRAATMDKDSQNQEQERVKEQFGNNKEFPDYFTYRCVDGDLESFLDANTMTGDYLVTHLKEKIAEMLPENDYLNTAMKFIKQSLSNVIRLFLTIPDMRPLLIDFSLFMAVERLTNTSKGLFWKDMGPRYGIFKFNYTTDYSSVIIAVYDRINQKLITIQRVATKQIPARVMALPFCIYLFCKFSEMNEDKSLLDKPDHLVDAYCIHIVKHMRTYRNGIRKLINGLNTGFQNRDWDSVTCQVEGFQKVFVGRTHTTDHSLTLSWLLEVVWPMLRENNKNLNEVTQMMRYVNLTTMARYFDYKSFASKVVKLVRSPGSQTFNRVLLAGYLSTIRNVTRNSSPNIHTDIRDTKFKMTDYKFACDPFNAYQPISNDNHFVNSLFMLQIFDKHNGDVRDGIVAFNNFADKAVAHKFRVAEVERDLCDWCQGLLTDTPFDGDRCKEMYFKMKQEAYMASNDLCSGRYRLSDISMFRSKLKRYLFKAPLLKVKCISCAETWARLECLKGIIIVRRSEDGGDPYSFINFLKTKIEVTQQDKPKYSMSVAEIMNQMGFENSKLNRTRDLSSLIEQSGLLEEHLSELSKTTNVKVELQEEADLLEVQSKMKDNYVKKQVERVSNRLKDWGIRMKKVANDRDVELELIKIKQGILKEGHIHEDIDDILLEFRKKFTVHTKTDAEYVESFESLSNGEVVSIHSLAKRMHKKYKSSVVSVDELGKTHTVRRRFEDCRKAVREHVMGVYKDFESRAPSQKIECYIEEQNKPYMVHLIRTALEDVQFADPYHILTVGLYEVFSDRHVESGRAGADAAFYANSKELELEAASIMSFIEECNGQIEMTPGLKCHSMKVKLARMLSKLRQKFNTELIVNTVWLMSEVVSKTPSIFVDDRSLRYIFGARNRLNCKMFFHRDLTDLEKMIVNMICYDKNLEMLIKSNEAFRSERIDDIGTTWDDQLLLHAIYKFTTMATLQSANRFKETVKNQKASLIKHKSEKVITAVARKCLELGSSNTIDYAVSITDTEEPLSLLTAAKVQLGNVRDLGVLNLNSKVVQSCSEKITDLILEGHPHDMMVNYKRKETSRAYTSEAYRQMDKGECSLAEFGMLDNQAWGPKMRGIEMMVCNEASYSSCPLADKICSSFLTKLSMKRVFISEQILKSCLNVIRLRKMDVRKADDAPDGRVYYIMKNGRHQTYKDFLDMGYSNGVAMILDQCLCYNRLYFVCSAHMIQGIPHKMSSLSHTAFLTMLDKITQLQLAELDEVAPLHDPGGQVVRALEVELKSVCSSDDSNPSIKLGKPLSIVRNGRRECDYIAELYWRTYIAVGLLINQSNSAKSVISCKMSEIYSTFSRHGTILSPTIKDEAAIAAMNPAITMYLENQQMVDQGRACLRNGSSLMMVNVVYFARRLRNLTVNAHPKTMEDNEYWENTNYPHHRGTNILLDPIPMISFVDALGGFSLLLVQRAYSVFEGIKSKLADGRELTIQDRIWCAALMNRKNDLQNLKFATRDGMYNDNLLNDPYKYTYPKGAQKEVKSLLDMVQERISQSSDVDSFATQLCAVNRKAFDHESALSKFQQAYKSPSIVASFATSNQTQVKKMASMTRTMRRAGIGKYIDAPFYELYGQKCLSLLEQRAWKPTVITEEARAELLTELVDITNCLFLQGADNIEFLNMVFKIESSVTRNKAFTSLDIPQVKRHIKIVMKEGLLRNDPYVVMASMLRFKATADRTGIPHAELSDDADLMCQISPSIRVKIDECLAEDKVSQEHKEYLMNLCRRSILPHKGGLDVVVPQSDIRDPIITLIATRISMGFTFETILQASVDDIDTGDLKEIRSVTEVLTIVNNIPFQYFDKYSTYEKLVDSTLLATIVQDSIKLDSALRLSNAERKCIDKLQRFIHRSADMLFEGKIVVEEASMARNSWSDRVTLLSDVTKELQPVMLSITCIDGRYYTNCTTDEGSTIATMLVEWVTFNIRNSRYNRPKQLANLAGTVAPSRSKKVWVKGIEAKHFAVGGYSIVYVSLDSPFTNRSYKEILDSSQLQRAIYSGGVKGLTFGVQIVGDVMSGNIEEASVQALNSGYNLTRKTGNRFISLFSVPDDSSVSVVALVKCCEVLTAKLEKRSVGYRHYKEGSMEIRSAMDIVSVCKCAGGLLDISVRDGKIIATVEERVVNRSYDSAQMISAFADVIATGSCKTTLIKLVLPLIHRIYIEAKAEVDPLLVDKRNLVRKMTQKKCAEFTKLISKNMIAQDLSFSISESSGTAMLRRISNEKTRLKCFGLWIEVYFEDEFLMVELDRGDQRGFKQFMNILNQRLKECHSKPQNYGIDLVVLSRKETVNGKTRNKPYVAIKQTSSAVIDAAMTYFRTSDPEEARTAYLIGSYIVGNEPVKDLQQLCKYLSAVQGRPMYKELDESESLGDDQLEDTDTSLAEIILYALAISYKEKTTIVPAVLRAKALVLLRDQNQAVRKCEEYKSTYNDSLRSLDPVVDKLRDTAPSVVELVLKEVASMSGDEDPELSVRYAMGEKAGEDVEMYEGPKESYRSEVVETVEEHARQAYDQGADLEYDIDDWAQDVDDYGAREAAEILKYLEMDEDAFGDIDLGAVDARREEYQLHFEDTPPEPPDLV